MQVANSVHQFRRDKGVTQEQLAKSIGVTRQTIIAIEKGHYTPSVLLALKISRYFKKPVEKIFQLTDNSDSVQPETPEAPSELE